MTPSHFTVRLLVATAGLLLVSSGPSVADDDSGDVKEIHAAAAAYVKDFDKGDAEAVAAHWTKDGDLVDESGRELKGRAAITEAFEALFAQNDGLALELVITSVRFPTDNVAIEDGVSVVHPQDGAPRTARYTAVRVRDGNGWKLASVRESAAVRSTNHEHLAPLSWLVGDWVDEGANGDVLSTSCDWAMNGNFLVRTFRSTLKDNTLGSGVQWIGWDPAEGVIRSWSFDDGGGFGHAEWSARGDAWAIESTSVLADGTRLTETGLVKRVDDDTISFQATKRTIGGKAVEDSPPIRIKRAK